MGFSNTPEPYLDFDQLVGSNNNLSSHGSKIGTYWSHLENCLECDYWIRIIIWKWIELCRVTLPYDPWYDEAQHYRRMAVKNGDKPSSWFGAYRYYKPMDFKTWIDKVGDWIENVEKEIKIDDPANFANLSLELGKNSNVINVQRQPQTSGGY